MEVANRRPLKTRSAAWAGALARSLATAGFTPNAVSVIGIGFALGGGFALATLPGATSPMARAGHLIGAAACVQLRLLCNMLDGLIAVENNLKSKLGDLFNEVPDRIEDVALLLGLGVAAGGEWGVTLGWCAALLAVGTAYVRQLGGSLGFKQDFCGPFAKQHRMFFLTVTCLVGAVMVTTGRINPALPAGLALIAAGTLVTLMRRLVRLANAMRAR